MTVSTPARASGVYSTAGTIAYLPLNNDILNYSSGTGVPFVGTGNANIVFASTPSGLPAGYANICLYNNGSTYVTLSSNSPLNNNFQFPANNVSYSFWFRSTATQGNFFGAIFHFIVGSPGGGNTNRVCMFVSTNSTNTLINFTASTAGADAVTSFSYSNNTWYHIAWTISATGNYIIYVNGSNVVSVASGVTDTPNAATTYNTFFTESSAASYTKGYLSDFRVYNSVLSSTQVNNIYSSSSVTLNAPTIGSATSITTTSAVVSFTAPSGVATGTTYDASAAGVIYGASAYPATSIYLGGLTSNTLYNMAVAATNNYERSPYSSTVAVTTVPSAPTALTFISATASSVTFSFTAPTGAATITGYTPYVNGVSGTGSGTPSSYTVTGLSQSTTYSISITATNSGGTSAQSTSVNMTTGIPSTLHLYLPLNNDLLNYASGSGVAFSAASALYGNTAPLILSSNYLSSPVSLNNSYTPPANTMSISCWFYVNALPSLSATIFVFHNSSFKTIQLQIQKSGSLFALVPYLEMGNNQYTGTVGSYSYSAGQWYHFVWAINNNNSYTIYMNGTSAMTSGGGYSFVGGVSMTANGLLTDTGTNTLNGRLDEFRIYSSVLNQTQVNTLYNGGAGNLNPGF